MDWRELGPTSLRFWRRLCGGHWERWYVDSPVNASVWHRVPVCSNVSGSRPTGLCRGTAICEGYR